MTYTTRIGWETLRVLASTALTGSYQAVGTPLLFPSYILKLVNTGDTTVTISINGTSDIDILPANSFFLYDEYKTQFRELLAQGTQIYVKGTAGTTGSIYVVSQYLVVA